MDYGKMYTKYKERYDRGGCTKEQLHRIVEINPSALTPAGYEDITGEPYE